MADNFGVKVKLKPDASLSEFNKELESIKSSIKPIKIKIELDSQAVTKDLKSLISKLQNTDITKKTTSSNNSSANRYAQEYAAAKKLADMQNTLTKASLRGYDTGKSAELYQKAQQSVIALNAATKGSNEYSKAQLNASTAVDNLKRSISELSTKQTVHQKNTKNSIAQLRAYSQAFDVLNKNPKISTNTEMLGKYQKFIDSTKDTGVPAEKLHENLAALNKEARQFGLMSESFGERIKSLFGAHLNTAIAMAGLHALQQGLRAMVTDVVNIDTAMTNLKKVSTGTSSEYNQFLEGATSRAKELGATLTDVVDASAEFSRLGYNLKDSATLGDAAVMYKNVSEYANIEDASQSLVSTMKAFGIEASSISTIVDKFNEVGNNYAISSAGLGDAMQRSAAALSLAGNSLDESLGIVTAANEIVQNPETVGVWAKTLTMYLRAAKVEAEEAGIETEGMAKSVSELRDSILSLTGNRVDIMQDDTTFKSTVQIMREIASVYDSLTDVDQASLLNLISGKRQANTTAALISNYSQVEKVIASATNSAGSATKENEKYLDSIGGKVSKFQAQFQTFNNAVIGSEFVKGTVDTGSGILGMLTAVTEKFGAIPGIVAPALAAVMSFNNAGLIQTKTDSSKFSGTAFTTGLGKNKRTFESQLKNDLGLLQDVINQQKSGIDINIDGSLNKGSTALKEYIKNTSSAQLSTKQFDAAQRSAFASSTTLSGGLKSVGSALKGISAAAANMLIFTAIAAGISAVIKVVDKMTMSAKEAAQVTEDVVTSYQNTSQAIESNISSVENLSSRYDELSKGVDDLGKNVSLSTDGYKEYKSIVAEIVGITPSVVQGYNDEGDAIVRKNGLIQESIDLLKKQRAESASSAVYGGTGENDGNKTNYAASVIDFSSTYNKASKNAKSVSKEIGKLISEAYKSASDKGLGEDVQKALQDITGVSVESVKRLHETSRYGVSTSFETQGDIYDLIEQQQEKLSGNLPQLIQLFNDLGVVNTDVANDASNLASEYNAATSAIDETAGSLRTMMQAIFESNSDYFDLNQTSKSFLEDFRTGIDTDQLNKLASEGENTILDLTKNLFENVKNNPDLQKSISDIYALLAKSDTLPANELIKQGDKIVSSIQNGVGDGFDVSEIFNFGEIADEISGMLDTVATNVQMAFEDIGKALPQDRLKSIIKSFDLESLSKHQLATLNNALASTGDNAAALVLKFEALAKAGALPQALEAVSGILADQGVEFKTVSGAIAEYQKAIEGLTSGATEHESMVSIYDEFAKSVNKGQINTEAAREQMDLLIGKVVSLEDAKKWVKDNEGLFITGTDDEKVGQDLTATFNTLHKKYNTLAEDQKRTVDSLMNVNWTSGSIQVAQADVVALADAFGVSATTMQQSLDLISTYSDSVEPKLSNLGNSVDALNGATYSLGKDTDDNLKKSQVAWDKLTVAQKKSIESLISDSDVDISKITVSELEDITTAYNNMIVGIGNKQPTANQLETYFNKINEAAGETISTVTRLEDGSWSIDISNLNAVASSLNSTDENAKIALSSLNNLKDEAGNPITVSILGVPTKTDETYSEMEKALAPLENEYNININTDDAIKKLQAVNTKANSIASGTRTIKFDVKYNTSTVPVPTTSGTTDTNFVGPVQKQGYAGIAGAMAFGGRSNGGRTLVGELGRELYISRDGKQKRIVGKNGMEVITLQKGDAIVPNNITESLISGGMSSAASGTGTVLMNGANTSGALDNLKYATNGKYTNWTSSSSSKSSSSKSDSDDAWKDAAEAAIKALKYQLDMEFITSKQYYDELTKINDKYYRNNSKYLDEERDLNVELYQLKKQLADEWLSVQEHQIDLLSKQDGTEKQRIALFQSMQDKVRALADEARKRGIDENSETIRSLQTQWWSYHDEIVSINEDAFDKMIDSFDQYVEDRNDLNSWGTDTEVAALKRKLQYIERQYAQDLISYEKYIAAKRDVSKSLYDIEQDSLDNILDMTKDLIKQENEDKIDALEKQVEAYRKIVELKKKSLELTEAQRSYDMDVSDKTSEISKLQAQADALAMDDSREGKIKRNALLEQIAEKQKELAEFQHDHSVEMQQDALDTQLDAYEQQKDDEIDALEKSLNTEGKLYAAAIKRINGNWDTLYKDLVSYNKEYGSGIETDVLTPWNNVLSLMEQVKMTASDMNFESLKGNSQSNAESAFGDEAVSAKVQKMRNNASKAVSIYNQTGNWDDNQILSLNSQNKQIASEIERLTGKSVTYDSKTGKWYIEGDELFSKYHSGGVVGGGADLKQNEIMAVLQKKELVLTEQQQKTLYDHMTGLKNMALAPLRDFGSRMSSVSAVNSTDTSVQPINIEVDASVQINSDVAPDVIEELKKYPQKVADIVGEVFTKYVGTSRGLKTRLT